MMNDENAWYVNVIEIALKHLSYAEFFFLTSVRDLSLFEVGGVSNYHYNLPQPRKPPI